MTMQSLKLQLTLVRQKRFIPQRCLFIHQRDFVASMRVNSLREKQNKHTHAYLLYLFIASQHRHTSVWGGGVQLGY